MKTGKASGEIWESKSLILKYDNPVSGTSFENNFKFFQIQNKFKIINATLQLGIDRHIWIIYNA